MHYETPEEALRACVDRLGGMKKVGVMLWPTLEEQPERAGRKLADHLNEERAEKLSLAQATFLFRKACEAGFHDGMHAFNRLCRYSPSRPLNGADELAELRTAAVAAVHAAEAAGRALREHIERTGDEL